MSDDPRPAPQFGQYASPEEQRARMGMPPDAPLSSAPVPPAAAPPQPVPAKPGTGRLVDRAATVAMLVYGIFSIVQSIPLMLDATDLLAAMGLDVELSDPGALRGWGVAAVVALAAGWIATAALSWRMIRRGRLSFWVPIAGAVVFNLLASLLVVLPLVGDPAVVDALLRMQDQLG